MKKAPILPALTDWNFYHIHSNPNRPGRYSYDFKKDGVKYSIHPHENEAGQFLGYGLTCFNHAANRLANHTAIRPDGELSNSTDPATRYRTPAQAVTAARLAAADQRHEMQETEPGTRERINDPLQFWQTLAAGGFAFPGGYPLYFITEDGEALSFEAAQEYKEEITEAINDGSRSGWRVVGCAVNYEDAELFCSHTGNRIESAYAEPEEAQSEQQPTE